jgi:heme/copper-type cytochrome/quinol oxidase subunit 2
MNLFLALLAFIVTLLILAVFNYKSIVFNNPLSQKDGRLYRRVFNVSIFSLACICLCFYVLILLDNYNVVHQYRYDNSNDKNYEQAYESNINTFLIIFIPIIILIISLSIFSYLKLKNSINATTQIKIFLLVFSTIEFVFGVLCLLTALFSMVYGFGRFDGIN